MRLSINGKKWVVSSLGQNMNNVVGPDIIDYEEWNEYYSEFRKVLQHVSDHEARRDLVVLFENVQEAWLDYSRASLFYKKHNEQRYKKYEEAKDILGKQIMVGGLMGL